MPKEYLNPGFPYVELFAENGDKVSVTSSENLSGADVKATTSSGSNLKNLQVIPHHFKQLTHETKDSSGQGIMTMQLFDPTFDRIENFVIVNKDTMSIRYGWYPTNNSSGKMSKTYKVGALTFQSNILNEGTEIELKFGSAVSIRSQKVVRNNAWVDTPISDIVRELLLQSGYAEDDFTIEPTIGTISITQDNTTNEYFIKNVLAPRAKSAVTGYSGYVFKVEGNTAKFCTRGYRYQLIKRYIWRLGQDSEIISFSPAFVGQHMLLAGGGPIEVGSHDILEKRYRKAQFFLRGNPANFLSLGLETFDVLKQRTEESTCRYYSVPYQSQPDLERWAAWKWVKARQMAWMATARVMGDPSITADPSHFIEIQVVKPNGQLHYLSGKYGILRATHVIDGSGYFTDLELITDGSLKDEERARGDKPPNTPDTRDSDLSGLTTAPGPGD